MSLGFLKTLTEKKNTRGKLGQLAMTSPVLTPPSRWPATEKTGSQARQQTRSHQTARAEQTGTEVRLYGTSG
jgi:hypothetical protein